MVPSKPIRGLATGMDGQEQAQNRAGSYPLLRLRL
jgi:hypothetical protein